VEKDEICDKRLISRLKTNSAVVPRVGS